jgi:hypothetical protein
MENETQDRFANWMGVLIAIVALVTAVAAWRAAVASREAGLQDYRAVVSVLKAQETQTLNYATAFSHLTAFTDFVINDELLTQLHSAWTRGPSQEKRAALEAQIAQVDKLAATNRNFFPGRFARQDGTYDLTREVAESYADAERRLSHTPDANLALSAALDTKTFTYIQSIVVLSIALLLFTLASALHPARRVLRWASAALGILLLGASIVVIVMTEFA